MENYFKNIPNLGFGLMRLPMVGEEIDIEQTKQMVDLFLEKGFSYFDTAYLYEGSEIAIKKALVDRYPRDKYQIATKLAASFASNSEEAKKMFEISLERTGLDFFDFYLLHDLGEESIESFDKFGIWDFLNEQKEKGLIKHLGFSIHSKADHLDKVLTDHPEMEFVQLQINYADWESEVIESKKCYEVAKKHGKPIIIMEPVKGGMLANLPKQVENIFTNANPNMSLVSWAIRYVASLDEIITVLSGMSNIEQMKDNISVMENFKPLTDEEYVIVEKAQKELEKIPQVPCTACNYCIEGCPENIPISSIFKIFNEYIVYNTFEVLERSYDWATTNKGKASDCTSCGNCEKICTQKINVMDELKRFSDLID